MPILILFGSYFGGYALGKHLAHKKYMSNLSVVNSQLAPGAFMSLLKHPK